MLHHLQDFNLLIFLSVMRPAETKCTPTIQHFAQRFIGCQIQNWYGVQVPQYVTTWLIPFEYFQSKMLLCLWRGWATPGHTKINDRGTGPRQTARSYPHGLRLLRSETNMSHFALEPFPDHSHMSTYAHIKRPTLYLVLYPTSKPSSFFLFSP